MTTIPAFLWSGYSFRTVVYQSGRNCPLVGDFERQRGETTQRGRK